MTISITAEMARYLDALFARRGHAVDPRRASVRFADGRASLASECHANVDRWASENPETKAVRGWAIITSSDHSFYIAAHSVIEDETGSLIDITPLPDQRVSFLRHPGSEEEFHALRQRFTNIVWPLPST